MTTLSYRGYQGLVSYEDGRLVIQVPHVADLLTAECESAREVESRFRDLIDDYLEACRELGRAPDKPFKGSFNVRMAPDEHRKAAMAASDAGLSLNAWVVQGIRRQLAEPDEPETRRPSRRLGRAS